MVRFVAGAVAALLAASPVHAVPLDGESRFRITEPVLQWFIGSQASVVETGTDMACMVSQRIPIEQSTYTAPDGTAVPFSDVVRSYAASLQVIAEAESDAQALRIQFKYSPTTAEPLTLRIGGRVVDLQPWLEPGGDSVRITDPDILVLARAALSAGIDLVATGTSRDTGRRVTDRVGGVDFSAFDACRAGPARAARDPDLAPLALVGLSFTAYPTAASRATPDEMAICRVDDPRIALYRGQLDHVTGLVSPTRDVFVSFAANGAIDQVFVPGIVEGRLGPDGTLRTMVSIAAHGNRPLQEARISGCLGSAPMALCEEPATGGQRLGQCVGALLSADDLEDSQFLIGALPSSAPGAVPPVASTRFAPGPVAALVPGGGGGPRGPLSGFGGGGGGGGGNGSAPPPLPPAIPLPPAMVLLLSSLGVLFMLKRQQSTGGGA